MSRVKELTALVAIDRATSLESMPMDTIVAQHLVIAKIVNAGRSAAEYAEPATEAREVGLEADARELDRAPIALDERPRPHVQNDENPGVIAVGASQP